MSTLWKHLIAVALSVLVFVGLAIGSGVVAVLFGIAALTSYLSQIYWYPGRMPSAEPRVHQQQAVTASQAE